MSAHGPIIIMAGGTGGHIFPGLAVARDLRARGRSVIWLGARNGLEAQIVPHEGFPFEAMQVSALRGKGLMRKLRAPFMLLRALREARAVLRRHQPSCVLSMGGFAAGPGGVAAWMAKVPLVVHEQNSVPGFTNRVLARFARRILCGFPNAFAGNPAAEWVGNPVRAEIAALKPHRHTRTGAQARVLVLGGSQGARALNHLVPSALAEMDASQRPQVRHQCGQRMIDEARAEYTNAGLDIEPEAFIADMGKAYADADLVVCRAGALTLAELCAAGLPSLLVPFPHAVDDHQTRNAADLVAKGAALMVAEKSLTPAALAKLMQWMVNTPAERQRMAAAVHTLARPDAAKRVADVCLEVAA